MDSLLSENRRFPPPKDFVARAHISSQYEALYTKSLENSDAFWLEQSKTLSWKKEPKIAGKWVWDTKKRHVEHSFFEDGRLNVCYNCLDRHLDKKNPAIIWQGEEDDNVSTLSYPELHRLVCKTANVLKAHGVKKGDRVCIYLPMIVELAIVTLACARIGAIHSIIFGGFSAQSVSDRINDCGAGLLVSVDTATRGGKQIPFKDIINQALKSTPSIRSTLIVGENFWPQVNNAPSECEPEWLEAEHPLFILYTSGSTGKPKGVVHCSGGYLLYASLTHKYVFDIQKDDVYWCTADLGWVTGHSYVLYGPLCNGATSLMYEGTPTFPDFGRFWHICDKHKVSIFYTAPTAIRTLMRAGDEWPKKYSLQSLRLLGSVGEPINPEAWIWYYEYIGKKRCPIVDTWWQTETGGILISPLPGSHTLKPGSATRPFFGIEPKILNKEHEAVAINEGGELCIMRPWPGMMRTTWGDHNKFIDTYFTAHPDCYFSGDGCRRDADGDFWLLGRIDDVVNVSGHRIGTAEVESALVSHEAVSEAAVVPVPHSVKGQGLYAFVLLRQGKTTDAKTLFAWVKKEIGSIAVPEAIQFSPALPKTRSGKIMRRILRKIAEGQTDALGDITTLDDPSVVDLLVKGRICIS